MVAYPDGIGHAWKAGPGCCGQPLQRGVDDVGYLHWLVSELGSEDRIDPHRVYAVGMSNGAMLAYTWASDRPNDLAGIGPVAGSLQTSCARPAPISVVAVYGSADRNVPPAGGVGPRGTESPRWPTPSAGSGSPTAAPRPPTSTPAPGGATVLELSARSPSPWSTAPGTSGRAPARPGRPAAPSDSTYRPPRWTPPPTCGSTYAQPLTADRGRVAEPIRPPVSGRARSRVCASPGRPWRPPAARRTRRTWG